MGCIRTEEPVSDTARRVQIVVLEEEKVCEEKDKAFKDAAVKLEKDKQPAVTEKDLKDVAFIETNEKINQDDKKEEAAKKATAWSLLS